MEITKELLEGRINGVREQGVKAANIVQQAIGAELALREAIATLETEEESDVPKSSKPAHKGGSVATSAVS